MANDKGKAKSVNGLTASRVKTPRSSKSKKQATQKSSSGALSSLSLAETKPSSSTPYLDSSLNSIIVESLNFLAEYIWIADVNERGEIKYLFFSPSVEKITGRPVSYYMEGPQNWVSTVYPEDLPHVEKAFKRIVSGKSEREADEHRIILPDGSLKWVSDRVTAIRGPGGTTRISGVVADITERKRMESDRAMDNERLEAHLKFYRLKDPTIEDIQEYALEEGVKITGSKMGFLGFMNEDETEYTIYSVSKTAMADCEMITKPLKFEIAKSGIWGDAVRFRKPIIINDYDKPYPSKKGYPKGHVKVTRFLGIPVFEGSKIVAVIGMANKESDYTETDAARLGLLMESMWNIARRTIAENALKESEHNLSITLDSIGDGVIATDTSGKIVRMNPIAERLTGWSVKEALGRPIKDVFKIVNSITGAPVETPVERVLKSGSIVGLGNHTALISKDGKTYQLKDSGSPITDAEGKIVGVVMVFRDATAQYEKDMRIVESEERYRSLFNNLPVSVWEEDASVLKEYLDTITLPAGMGFREYLDRNPDVAAKCLGLLKVTNINDESLDLYRSPTKEILLHDLRKVMTPESQGAFKDILVALREGKTSLEMTTQQRTLDGDTIDVFMRWNVAKGYENTLSRIILSFVDITARNRAESALKAIFEGTAVGTGNEFFKSLVKNIASILKVKHVFVGRLIPGNKISTIAVWEGKDFANNFEYDLNGTPCRSVFDSGLCYYPRQVAELFREDVLLKEMGIESYCGIPLRDAEGNVNGIMVTLDDKPLTNAKLISDIFSVFAARAGAELGRMIALENLAKERDLAKKYIDTARNIFVVLDREGRVTLLNTAGADLIGLPMDKIIGTKWFQMFVPEEDRETVLNAFSQIIAGKIAPMEFFENRIVRSNGERRIISWHNNFLMDADGKITGAVSSGEDITDRRAMENALRESEATWRSLAQHSPEHIILLDDKGTIKFMNYPLPGRPKDDLIGKSFLKLYDYESRKNAQTCIERVIATGKPGKFEISYEDSTGNLKHFEAYVGPVIESAEITGATVYSRDVTDRKRAEEELLKSQKLESIGVLAGGIAHDFNNILTSLWGNIQLAKLNVKEKTELREMLDDSDRACMRAKELTNQLLTFARGGAPIRKIVSIGKLVKDSAELALRGSRAKTTFEIADDLWMANIDQGQINQAINNIVMNADESMPDGGMIEIRAENVSLDSGENPQSPPIADGKYVKISIRDQGVGIHEDHLQFIFDPYFTTKQKGSGLGLSTSYSIVVKHGGYIRVESKLGKGTTVEIYLPAAGEEKREKAKLSSVMRKSEKMSVLLMDDEEDVRKIGAAILARLGYDVELVLDGEEAINKYKSAKEKGKPYAAVILDLTIPGGMGGKEAVRKLMEIDPMVKAIVASGYSNDPIMSNFCDFGFCGVIGKPYSIEELQNELEKVIENVR